MSHSLRRRVEKLEGTLVHGLVREGMKLIFREVDDEKLARFIEIVWGFGAAEDPHEHLARGEKPETLARWCSYLGAQVPPLDQARTTFMQLTERDGKNAIARGGDLTEREWEDARRSTIRVCGASSKAQRFGPFVAHLESLSFPRKVATRQSRSATPGDGGSHDA